MKNTSYGLKKQNITRLFDVYYVNLIFRSPTWVVLLSMYMFVEKNIKNEFKVELRTIYEVNF